MKGEVRAVLAINRQDAEDAKVLGLGCVQDSGSRVQAASDCGAMSVRLCWALLDPRIFKKGTSVLPPTTDEHQHEHISQDMGRGGSSWIIYSSWSEMEPTHPALRDCYELRGAGALTGCLSFIPANSGPFRRFPAVLKKFMKQGAGVRPSWGLGSCVWGAVPPPISADIRP